MKSNKILFVYGTLKTNCRGNYMLANSTFIGNATTAPDYELYGGFTYPALIHAKNSGFPVEGELYEVDEKTLHLLDIYEGVDSGLYQCEKIKLQAADNHDFSLLSTDVYSYVYYGNMKNFRRIEKWTCS